MSVPSRLFRSIFRTALASAIPMLAAGLSGLALLGGPARADQTIVAEVGNASLYIIDTVTGNRTPLSTPVTTPGHGTGPNLVQPRSVALDSNGHAYVGLLASPGIMVVDVTTGNRTPLPNPGNIAYTNVNGLVLDGNGNLIATATNDQTIYRINLATGVATVIASPSVGSGDFLGNPGALFLDSDGSIIYGNLSASQPGLVLVRLNPTTLARTTLSSSSVGAGPVGATGVGEIVKLPNGSLAVSANSDPVNYVFLVDPATGNRTVLSSSTVGSGPKLTAGGTGLGLTSDGTLLTLDYFGSALYAVDTTTGARRLVSSTSPAGTGQMLLTPYAMLVSAVASVTTIPTTPNLTAVTPASGPVAGGTSITITGTRLTGATAVTIGGLPATGVTVASDSSLTAVTPAHAAGAASVLVTTPNGTNAANTLFTYGAPTISAISGGPGATAGGARITITGTGLAGATAVTFGGIPAASFTVNSDTSITAVSPAGTGTVDVTVTTTIGSSLTGATDQFIYDPAIGKAGYTIVGNVTDGSVVIVDLATGNRSVLSSSSVGTGPALANSASLALDTSGHLYVGQDSGGGIIVVDVATGNRTQLPNPGAIPYSSIYGLMLDANGNLIASDLAGSIYQIDPSSGNATVLASATVGTGASEGEPAGLLLDTDGTIIYSDFSVGRTRLVRLDPATLIRTEITGGAVGSGVAGKRGAMIAKLPNGTLVTTSYQDTTIYLVSVNPTTGLRTVLSSPTLGTGADIFSTPGNTTLAGGPFSLASTTGGKLYLSSFSANLILRVDPATGNRTVVSSPTLGAGPALGKPFALLGAVVASVSTGQPFVDLNPPVVTGLSSATGPSAGGASVTITGTGLSNPQQILFGANAATAVTGVDDNTLTVTVPAGTAGTVDVIVTTVDGTSAATAADQYTYVAPPVFSSGTTASGTYSMAYTGTLFYQAVASNSPTYSVTAGTLPPGLALNPNSGNITGTPSAAGSYPVTLTASGVGGSTNLNLAITINKLVVPLVLSGLNATYNGSAHGVTAAATPSGLTVNVTYNGSSTAPTTPGAYAISATINHPNYAGTANGTLVISPGTQTITFPAIAGAVTGTAITLAGTSSSGLAISYAVTSGNAILVGNTLTLLDGSPVTIAATQSGSGLYYAATAVKQTISAKQAQLITVGPLPVAGATRSFTFTSTATSDLPVTYTLISGPATLVGATLSAPMGVAGTAVVQLSQAGDDTYAPAPSLLVTVNLTGSGPLQFLGTFTVTTASDVASGVRAAAASTGSIGAAINSDHTSGTIIGTAGGSAFVLTLPIGTNGAFSGSTTAITAPGSTVTGTLTFTGTLSGTTLSGTIAPLGASFSVTADPTTGASATVAGFYQAASLGSASGSSYTLVGTQGEALVVAVTPTGVVSGTGTVSASNIVTVTTPQGATVTGSVNPTTTAVSLTVTSATGASNTYSGISTAVTRTDRLVNLSSRGMVTGANVLASGLVISGSASKTLLLRAVGPGLATFGVPGMLAHPHLQLFNAAGQVISDSTAWGGAAGLSTMFVQVGAFPLVATSADAAVTMSLAPGQYTLQISNAGTDAGGIALAEIYDASANPGADSQRLINISSRATVGSGAASLTGGFVVTGNSPKTVLIRGIGPGLAAFGVPSPLADPTLTLFDGTNTVIAQNDNWGAPLPVAASQSVASAADINAAGVATAAFALTAGSKDAALVITLPPGSYTAQVTGGSGATGTALVEIYELPQ